MKKFNRTAHKKENEQFIRIKPATDSIMTRVAEPVTKKLKREQTGAEREAEREAETSFTPTAELVVVTSTKLAEPVTNDQLEEFFDLSNKKSFLATKTRFTVRKCKLEGDVSLDIREYHEKDGDMKPGQKGITLALDQYKEMRDLVKSGSIDAIIKKQGGDVE